MTALPIVRRELLAGSRRGRTFSVRMAGGAAAILLGALAFLGSNSGNPQNLGSSLFSTFAVLLFSYGLLAGLFVTSDTISSEKREGTLGLLFLTDLRGYDVVLGKLVAASLTTFYGALTVFPVIAVTFVLGGVDPKLYIRVLLAVLNVLFFSLATGMLASSVCRRESRAFGLTLAILAGLNLLPWLGREILEGRFARHNLDDLLLFCPWNSCAMAFDFKKELFDARMAASLGIIHAYAWVFLFLSFRIVPHAWQQTDSPTKRGIAAGWAGRFFPAASPVSQKAWRTARLGLNPYSWVAGRSPRAELPVLRFIAGWVIIWAGIWGRVGSNPWSDPWVGYLGAVTLQYPLKLWIAGRSCHRLIEDRRSGALELLLCTPLTPEKILSGQRLALRAQFGGPIAAVFLIEFLLFLIGLPDARAQNSLGTWAAMDAGNIIVTGADIWALVWVAMAHSLTSKGAVKAAGWAVAKVMVLPWVAAWIAAGVTSLLPGVNMDEQLSILYISSIFILIDVVLVARAKSTLRRRFYEAAMSGSEAPDRPWWQIFGSVAAGQKPPLTEGKTT